MDSADAIMKYADQKMDSADTKMTIVLVFRAISPHLQICANHRTIASFI